MRVSSGSCVGLPEEAVDGRGNLMSLTSHRPQVDVLDRLGGGPKGQSTRASGEGLDGWLTPRCLCDLQDSALAQRTKSGHPSWTPLLGGCLL